MYIFPETSSSFVSATLVFQYGIQNTNKIQILFELSTNSTQLFHNQSCTITNTHAHCSKIVKILTVYVSQPARTAVLELGKLSGYATSLRENSLSLSPIPLMDWCTLHTHTLDPPPSFLGFLHTTAGYSETLRKLDILCLDLEQSESVVNFIRD